MLTTAVVVGVGSLVAGAAGLYASGSTGSDSTGIAKTVEDSVSAVTQQVSDATQNITDYVSPDDPEPVEQPVVQPIPVEPVEQPAEQPVQPVEQPVEPVEPTEPMVKTPEQLKRQAYLEDRDSMHPMQGQSLTAAEEKELKELKKLQGGQRGGYGRPTWAPLNSGSSLIQALGVQPGSTAGNLLATATGSKNPQQIQQELVAVDQEIRRLKTQEFLTSKTLAAESASFGITRGSYTKQVNQRERSKNLLKIYERELASIMEPKQTTTDLKPEVFAKFPRNKADGTPMFTKKDKGGKDIDDFEAWKKDAYNKASALPDGDQLKPTAGDDANKWWNKLSSGPGSTKKASATEITKLLDDKESETIKLENAEQEIYKLKFTFESQQKRVEELRSQVREFIDKSREAEQKKEELLEELSAYKVPTSFWDKTKRLETPRSVVPTGEELNKLLVEYKDIQELIKQKQEEIDEEVGLQLENGTLKDSTNYDRLNVEMEDLETQRQNIIAKIEGRHVDQTKQLKEFSELDKFIKQLKDLKVKAVTVFDNPDFRKVFDMLTVMSLDTDPKSFIVNLDKYSNFFVTTKGLSAYNGEVLDKVFYFLKNYTQLISSSDSRKLISNFGSKFGSTVGQVDDNIKKSKSFLENSGDTTTDEFKKLDATQRRILEGRSTAWHTFFTDSDTLKEIPKAFSSVLFKTELEKLVKLEAVIKRRILDKIDKTKFDTVAATPPSLTSLTSIDITAETTDTRVKLSWTGADGAEFTLEDGTKVTNPHTIAGLTPSTDYTFKIIGTRGTETVESEIKVRTGPAPVPMKDAGTDTDKQRICLAKVGDLFTWNGNTYSVDSITEKDPVTDECALKFTALLGTDKYNVEIDDSTRFITKFEKNKPVLDTYVNLVTKLPKAGGTSLEKWRVYDTLGDGNCLLHAFVQATSPAYKSLKTINEKLESVKTTRSALAKETKSDGTSYFRSDRIKTDGEWLFTEDLEDLLTFVQTQTTPNKLVALIFDASKSTATANNPLGLSLSLGSYKLNNIPDDTDIIFIHATGNHFSSISDSTGNFMMKYSDAIKIPELKRALSPRLFPTIKFTELSEVKEIVKSGGGIVYSVKYNGKPYAFKDLRSQKSPTGGIQPNAGDWKKILDDIAVDPVYINMKNDKNTHIVSPLFLVLDDSNEKIGYTMMFLDNTYVLLENILQNALTEEQVKRTVNDMMIAFKELQNAGTMACPEHARNIMISNFGRINQHTVIIDLDENIIKCKDNTEEDALKGLSLIFDGSGTPNEKLPDSFKWLFSLDTKTDEKKLKDGITTFDEVFKLSSASASAKPAGKSNTYEAIRDVFLAYTKAQYDSSLDIREHVDRISDPLYRASLTQNPGDSQKILDKYKILTGNDLVPPPVVGTGPLHMPLQRPIKSKSFTGLFDSEGWIRKLQTNIDDFNKTYNAMNLETNKKNPRVLSPADFDNFNKLIVLIHSIVESLITNKVVTIDGDIATLRSLYDNTYYKDAIFDYNSVYTKFATDTTKKIAAKGVSTIDFLNTQLALVQSKMKGGNHETRRHRVRGMPKRAKTRRMY